MRGCCVLQCLRQYGQRLLRLAHAETHFVLIALVIDIILAPHAVWAFADYSVPRNITPQTAERKELQWTTPATTLFLSSTLGNSVASAFVLLDYTPTEDPKPSSTKAWVGGTIGFLNFMALYFTVGMEYFKADEVPQIPMTDEERTAYRAPEIRASYWLAGVQTACAGTLFLVATGASAKVATAANLIAVPLVTLLQWNRFKPGPARRIPSAVTFTPWVGPPGAGVAVSWRW